MKTLPWIFSASLAMATAQASSDLPERATFDSAGKLTSLLHDGDAFAVQAGLFAEYVGDVSVALQPHDQSSPVAREGIDLAWRGSRSAPNGDTIEYTASWSVDRGEPVRHTAELFHSGRWSIDPQALVYVIDVPRERFVGGTLNGEIALTAIKTKAQTYLFEEATDGLSFADAEGNWALRLGFADAHEITVTDHWDKDGRAYRVRVHIFGGKWEPNEPIGFSADFSLSGEASAPPAHVAIDAAGEGVPFDGFGANLCWDYGDHTTDFLVDAIPLAWSRHELKLKAWDAQGGEPDAGMIEDFERIQKLDQAGVPWIISAWRVPERLWTQSNAVPAGTFGRKIRADAWPELLDMITDYLVYLRDHYGAVPDCISFNEPDLGVNIGLTAAEHRDAIVRIIGHLRAHGFPEIAWVLGETANPRGQHAYVLPTALDAEAIGYCGVLSFHSWFGASAEQYRAWAAVAEWLDLPLIVGEMGDDPGAYRNRNYDSYEYGLRETALTFDILRFARPRASLYWQYTSDYGLVREVDGEIVETGRFYLMKQVAGLTPFGCEGIASSSDAEDLRVAAFRDGDGFVLHLLNQAPARALELTGLPAGTWRTVATTATTGCADGEAIEIEGEGSVSIELPARSLVTLIRE